MMIKNQIGRVLVNGDLSPGFDVNNGGKQGDPLSPLIYIIAMEGSNAFLKTSTDYHGLAALDNSTKIIHIGYADDTCLPIEDKPGKISALKDILHVFEIKSANIPLIYSSNPKGGGPSPHPRASR